MGKELMFQARNVQPNLKQCCQDLIQSYWIYVKNFKLMKH